MSTFSCELQGFDKVKQMFVTMGIELSASENRAIIAVAGKQIVDAAKSLNPFTGDIGRDFAKDLAVQRDHSKSAKNAEYVIIGPRFKPYSIHGKEQKVALIAQHMTQGFNQTDRLTLKGQSRGRVTIQQSNPVIEAAENTKSTRDQGIQQGIEKQVQKIKRRYPELFV